MSLRDKLKSIGDASVGPGMSYNTYLCVPVWPFDRPYGILKAQDQLPR